MLFGVLTGDIVQHSSVDSWDAIDKEVEELGLPVYFVPGNHDIYDNDLFAQRYGDKTHNLRTYRYFQFNHELFIILDANIDDWSIAGDQLSFLSDILNLYDGKVNTVFVFVHQLIWWSENSVFSSVVTNWPPYTPDTTNYWNTIEPIFQNYNAPVYIIAGDLGANKPAEPYLYFKDENIIYIAGGMGSGINDNYLIVDVDKQGQVILNLVALQGNRNRFGEINTYVLP
jgi:3',5'-cyclic AMP phosphodiesterase CpdA